MRYIFKIILVFCLLIMAASAFCQETTDTPAVVENSDSQSVVQEPGSATASPAVPATQQGVTNTGDPVAAAQPVNGQQPTTASVNPNSGGNNASDLPVAQSQPQSGQSQGRRNRGGSNNGGGGALYSMSFDKADAQSVLKFLSMISRIPIIIDTDLKGSMTILCPDKLSLQEIYEVMNVALRVRGFTMVGNLSSKIIRVIPFTKALTDTIGVTTGMELRKGVADTDLVTQVIPLNYADSTKLAADLKPLVSTTQASISSIASTNTLVITDDASNVRKLVDIIKSMDIDTMGVIEVNVYQCRYSLADSLATTLNNLFQTGTPSRPGQTPAAPQGGARGQRGQQAQGATSSDMGLAGIKGMITFASDIRTNRLIITGTHERIETVLEVVKELDIDTMPNVNVKFFPLQYGDATAVASQLNNLFVQPTQARATGQMGGGGGGRFGAVAQPAASTTSSVAAGLKENMAVPDVRTNSVIVTATEINMKAFESMIKQLDAPKVLSEITNVYPLKYAKAASLASTLNQLFRQNTSSGGRSVGGNNIASIFGLGSASTTDNSPLAQLKNITIVADSITNSLLVTGPPNTSTLMNDLIKKLDKRTAQVFIEVAIIDVTLDKDNQFGVEWQWNDANDKASTNFGQAALATGLKYSILNNNVSALLHALQSRNNVKVLSTPSITTADNVEAKISIGQDVPYVSNTTVTSGGNLQNTISFQSVAISLTVTPHVNGNSDVISLDVHQLINDIIRQDTTLNAPIIANREAQTTVTVKDGQTIVIGGIIQENKSDFIKAVPILSSIPLIGSFFKSKEHKTSRSELMVFLTPRILDSDLLNTKTTDDITNMARKQLSTQPPDGLITKDALKPLK